MRVMHRFFVSPSAVQETSVVLRGDVAHQIYRVLRMRPGDHAVVLDDSGWECEVELTRVGRDEAMGTILDRRLAGGEPRVRITLYQSLLKRDNFEWVLQKCTEIGVGAFVPLVSRRTIVSHPADVKAGKMERWRRIIAEAAEQSHRGRLPVLRDVLRFEQAMAEVGARLAHIHPTDKFDLALLPWEKEVCTGLCDCLAAAKAGRRDPVSVALFIGAEGGFAEEEIALARAHGATTVTLGPRILRAETAAVVAAALMLYKFGELG